MAIKVNIKSDEFLKKLRRLREKAPAAAFAAAKEFAGEAVAQGRKNPSKAGGAGITPVDKGNLISTLRVEIQGEKALFVSGGIQGGASKPTFVDYAYYVNYGTSKQPPRFFMERAVVAALRNKKSLAKQIVDSYLREF